MEKFEFYLDRKITNWVREHHTIEAEDFESAKKQMIEDFYDTEFNCGETFHYQEHFAATDEYMTPEENGGSPTAELIDVQTSDVIVDNVKKQ
jgi:hypothetical protein